MKLKVKKINPEAKIPGYAHKGDSGMDLYSVENVTIEQGERKVTIPKVNMPRNSSNTSHSSLQKLVNFRL